MKSFELGEVVQCKVTGVEPYGFFVKIGENFSGLVHISEISDEFVRSVDDYVSIDDLVYAKIVSIDKKHKQMKLSIKDLNFKTMEKVDESVNGFGPLSEMLPIWTVDYFGNIKNSQE